MSVTVNTVKTVNLLDVVRQAGEDASGGNAIWDEVRKSHWGNQSFTNDTLFIYALPSLNGEPLNETQQLIADICHDAIDEYDTIIFNVSW